jgi:hypothetical protein
MIRILSLPDQFHRRTFGIALERGVRPAFASGEPVVVEYDSVSGERLIEKIGNGVVPTTPPWVVFADVAGSAGGRNVRWDTEAMGGTTVIRDADLVFETDMFMGALEDWVDGAPVTAEGSTALGYSYWRVAVAGEQSYATVEVPPQAAAADGGTVTLRFRYDAFVPAP